MVRQADSHGPGVSTVERATSCCAARDSRPCRIHSAVAGAAIAGCRACLALAAELSTGQAPEPRSVVPPDPTRSVRQPWRQQEWAGMLQKAFGSTAARWHRRRPGAGGSLGGIAGPGSGLASAADGLGRAALERETHTTRVVRRDGRSQGHCSGARGAAGCRALLGKWSRWITRDVADYESDRAGCADGRSHLGGAGSAVGPGDGSIGRAAPVIVLAAVLIGTAVVLLLPGGSRRRLRPPGHPGVNGSRCWLA